MDKKMLKEVVLGSKLKIIIAIQFLILILVFLFFLKNYSYNFSKTSLNFNELNEIKNILNMQSVKISDLEQRLQKLSTNRNVNFDKVQNDPSEKKYRESVKIVNEPMAIQQVQSTEKKIMLMKIRLNRSFKELGKYPQSVEEFIEIMGHIPKEDISKSSRVSLDKDFRGGWFYDRNTGQIFANIE